MYYVGMGKGMLIIDRIEERMRQLDMSAAELSRAAKITEGAISNLLSGKRKQPRTSTLARIAKALETSVDYLTGATDNPFISQGEPLPEYAADVVEKMRKLSRARNYELLTIAQAFVEAEARVSLMMMQDLKDMLLEIGEEMTSKEEVDLLLQTLNLLERRWIARRGLTTGSDGDQPSENNS